MIVGTRALPLLAAILSGLVSCASLTDDSVAWPEDMTGENVVGISSGWAFVEADVDLENGTGPLANPLFGGTDVGSSTTDLEPVFGVGLKYFHYITNNWLFGFIYEHRIFDPDSTRPLNADVDIDDFGTNHFILDLRYQFDAMGKRRRFRPFVAVEFGYVPEVSADGEARYGAVSSLGLPPTTEDIELDGDGFFTLGFVAGGSYLLRENLTFDFGAFYEFALDPTEDTLELRPFPNSPPLDGVSSYDGELLEKGLYLSAGLSWVF